MSKLNKSTIVILLVIFIVSCFMKKGPQGINIKSLTADLSGSRMEASVEKKETSFAIESFLKRCVDIIPVSNNKEK